jgi:non-ribosomal peptide synthetase-like protein
MEKNQSHAFGTRDTTNRLLLHQLFEETVRKYPHELAVDAPPGTNRSGRITVTYAELSSQADTLARLLQSYVSKESVVGILLPRDSARLYAAQLAVLKVGAAYTCIDPMFPDERVCDVLIDSDAVVLLTDGDGFSRVSKANVGGTHLINVGDALMGNAQLQEPLVEPAWLDPSGLAYVIYTSGTTGRPKGVLIEHRSIVNLVTGDLDEYSLSPGDRIGQSSSAAYDSSVEETWLAFASGATVVVMDDDTARLGPDLIGWLRRERISVFCPPPTLLRATGCADPETALPDLKLLYVGGEALPRDVADAWSRGRRMVNGYGPTECTVTSLRGDVVENGTITIGQPVPGLEAWVLDDQLKRVPDGELGELCLGGIGLARGYWKRPELTAEKFIEHPELGRLYRTGDLVNRDSNGDFHYHGRIDSQVKIRGYRIELEGVESHLTNCAGVRAAACRVQESGGNSILVAFIVPENPTTPPDPEMLKSKLESELPSYMVPARFGVLEALPTTVGGKLNRAALPHLEGIARKLDRPIVLPSNAMEETIEAGFRKILHISEPISMDDDFFRDLGGDSLSAALLVTLLRDNEGTSRVTFGDIYEARTAAKLATCIARPMEVATPLVRIKSDEKIYPFLVTLVQAIWLLGVFSIGAWVAYLSAFELLPMLVNGMSLLPFILLLPIMGLVAYFAYMLLTVGFAVVVKRVLIGRYQARRSPVWGSFYLRNWIVQQAVRLIPWKSLEGTHFQILTLRALGAKLGQRIHIHRGVNLQCGGWDLLEIGDDVTLCQEAELRLVELDDGDIVIGPVSLGNGTTMDIRSTVGGHASMEEEAFLGALSSLPSGQAIPRGERWNGIPARPAGHAPVSQSATIPTRKLSPLQQSAALMIGRSALALLVALPLELLTLFIFIAFNPTREDVVNWIYEPNTTWTTWLVGMAGVVLAVPLTLLWEAAIMRLMKPVPEGSISRWSLSYVRIWLKTDMLDSASKWLSGTMFWPMWLRDAGMKVGAGCEISTIIDVIPEHIEVGQQTFFADGIYLGGPSIHRGIVTCSQTRLGQNTFLGNHVVIPEGQHLPDDILLGVATVADDTTIRTGTSWFGLPAFELPRREIVELGRELTHEPSRVRYYNRMFWELLRFALPVIPLSVFAASLHFIAQAQAISNVFLAMVHVATVNLGAVAFLCLLVLVLKWILLGRVRPGQHALWSCWCSRWDFLYVAWGQYATPFLLHLEGTLLLNFYLRAMGVKIGPRVVLGKGFSQVVDPDMIDIEEGATVNASYQAHTFEDRVLKTDYVFVRKNATVASNTVALYGADVGAGTHVAAHSVIMKRETLLSGLRYEGAPTRNV